MNILEPIEECHTEDDDETHSLEHCEGIVEEKYSHLHMHSMSPVNTRRKNSSLCKLIPVSTKLEKEKILDNPLKNVGKD